MFYPDCYIIKLCLKGTVCNCPRRTKGWQTHRFTLSSVRNFLSFKKMACEFPMPWLVLELRDLKENFCMSVVGQRFVMDTAKDQT